jgi:S-formylglutathione hydrolase FrmB
LDELRADPDSFREKGAQEAEILMDLYIIYGDDLEYLPENDISALIKKFPSGKPMPAIYAACGTEDDLLEENRKLRDAMKDTAFHFTYEEWPGAHEWYFFNDALKKTLEFWYKGT